MFKFIQTTEESRDCTCGYDIELDKVYTFREFIETVLTRKDELGFIYIYTNERPWFTCPSYKYISGQVTSEPPGEIWSKICNNIIKNVSARGGWGRMDYYVVFETDEPRNLH